MLGAVTLSCPAVWLVQVDVFFWYRVVATGKSGCPTNLALKA